MEKENDSGNVRNTSDEQFNTLLSSHWPKRTPPNFTGKEISSLSFNRSRVDGDQKLHDRSANILDEIPSICDGDTSMMTSSFYEEFLRFNDNEDWYYEETTKAILTFDAQTRKVLTWSRRACDLLGVEDFDDDDDDKIDAFFITSLPSPGEDLHGCVVASGDIHEVRRKGDDGKSVTISLWMKVLKSNNDGAACVLCIMSRANPIKSSFTIHQNGEVFRYDENFVTIFGERRMLRDDGDQELKITRFIPKFPLNQQEDGREDDDDDNDDGWEYDLCGRSASGRSFPLHLTVQPSITNSSCVCEMVVYPNISGVLSMNEAGKVVNFNPNFTSLMLGYGEKEMQNKDMMKLVTPQPRPLSANTSSRDTSSRGVTSSLPRDDEDYPPFESFTDDDDDDDDEEDVSLSWYSDDGSQHHHSQEQQDETDDSIQSSEPSEDCSPFHSSYLSTPTNPPSSSHFTTPIPHTPSSRDLAQPITCTSTPKPLDQHHKVTKQNNNNNGYKILHSDASQLEINLKLRPLRNESGGSGKTYLCWIQFSIDFTDTKHRSKLTTTAASCCGEPYKQRVSSIKSRGDDSTTSDGDSNVSRSESCANLNDSEMRLGAIACDFKFGAKLGNGAFGYVYAAVDKKSGDKVAVKFVKKRKLHKEDLVEIDGELLPLEIQLLKTLRHTNIVHSIGNYESKNFYSYVMRLHGAAGIDLFEFIDREPVIDERLSSYIFRQICQAVRYLHYKGIAHRDIKDENILIDEHFTCKLIDFGSACYFKKDEKFKNFCGTVEYCSPEIMLGQEYSGPKAEVWALGVTLYTLVYGENPYQDADAIIKAQLKPPHNLSKALMKLLRWLLDEFPSRRATIDEACEDEWCCMRVDVRRYHWNTIFPNHQIPELASRRKENDENAAAAARLSSDDVDGGSSSPLKMITDDDLVSSLSPLTRRLENLNF